MRARAAAARPGAAPAGGGACRNPGDRRHYALYLTPDGGQFMKELGQVVVAHEDDICAALDPAERQELNRLLRRVADQQGLTPGAHPGYRPPAYRP
ncbi:MAG: MarR family winged helix-turn-helix transcriptional regulator [Streptosporangiaceae bacterium]|jgi:hypothetical protein